MKLFSGLAAIAVTAFAIVVLVAAQPRQMRHDPPTFYRDVLPVLQQHCQVCHRAGEIAPFPLMAYTEAKAHAQKIVHMTSTHQMPPWFADPTIGKFADDPSLSPEQIRMLQEWSKAGAPAGNKSDAPSPPHWTSGWNIAPPDDVVTMTKPVHLPARGQIEYTYEIVPTGFTTGRWVQMSEVRPTARASVHHAVVYIRPPDSKWLRSAPIGVAFTADDLPDAKSRRESHWTDSDMLLVYAPGSSPDSWPDGMAKFIPAGSDLVFQMHYVTNGRATTDQSSVGMVFAKEKPKQRVITLQLTNSSFLIPPGADNFEVQVHGMLPNDATLLSFFPHMHLRGKRFEYDIVHPDGTREPLLRVDWSFHWQLSYKLAKPLFLKAGTELEATAWYDNSKNNPHNPDPTKMVRWGDQTTDEMMVGFFDIAVPAEVDKWQYFKRQ